MSKLQTNFGRILLGAVLVFGFCGVLVNAMEGKPALYQQDDVYMEECGACHLAYAPDLLPVESWRRMLTGLEDHFGESAEVDSETLTQLSGYLDEHGLSRGKPSPMGRLLRGLPAEPPL